MDVLLTHGYHLASDPHERQVMKPYAPLGILYLSAYLKQRGFDVGVFDSTFREPTELSRTLFAKSPPVVGIYCNLMTKIRVLEMVAEAKKAGARVVLGGPEPPFYADEYLSHGVDAVVFGEGEAAMVELLETFARSGDNELDKVAGIAFRNQDGDTVRTPSRSMIPRLDELPCPDRESIDLDGYLSVWREHHGLGSLSLICARGCPYHCDWCSHAVYGKSHRRRSPARVADELMYLHERYRPDQIWYADDVFTIKPSWTEALAQELRRRSLRIPFECISRADRLSEETIATLSSMGCTRIWIGSESGSQKILDAMGRGVQVEQVQQVSRRCRDVGIEVGMFIMVGYEDEEERDLQETVEHLKRARPDIVLTTIAYPIKGTGYFEKVRERVKADGAWEQRTDRANAVSGRHSRRYYEGAMRWMLGEVGLHREWHYGKRDLRRAARLVKHGGNWFRGRASMALAAGEVE